jgi:ABC-2 type transport system ATP-binding protein
MSVLVATGAGVRHHRRWLVQGLDLRVEPGETVAVTGPPGSGRTSALLALARRLRLSEGKIQFFGTATLGHVPGLEEPEPVFTVAEHVRERLALLGRKRDTEVPLHGLDPELPGRDLTPYQKQVLGLILAGLSDPAVIALDGVDAGLDQAEQAALWALLGVYAADGVAILVTAREVSPADVDQVVRLSDPQTGVPGRVTVLTAATEPAAHGVPAASLEPAATEADRA